MKKKVLLLFKSFARIRHSQDVQRILALPYNSYYSYDVNATYLTQEFKNVDYKKIRRGTCVIFLCAFYPEKMHIDQLTIERNPENYLQYIPLRYGVVKKKREFENSVYLTISLKEYALFTKSISEITSDILNSFRGMPKCYHCGPDLNFTDLNLVSLHRKFDKKRLREIFGNKSKKDTTVLDIINKINSIDSANNQSILTKFYFLPIIRITNHRDKNLRNYRGIFRYRKNKILKIQITYNSLNGFLSDIPDAERLINIKTYNSSFDNHLIVSIPLEVSDNIKSNMIEIYYSDITNFNYLLIDGPVLEKAKFSDQGLDRIENDLLIPYGEIKIPISKSWIFGFFNYLGNALVRLLQALPIAALLFKDYLVKLFNGEANFSIIVLIVIGVYIIVPTEKFLGTEIKNLIKKEKS